MRRWLRAVLRTRRERRRIREVERWARYWQARAMARDHAALGCPTCAGDIQMCEDCYARQRARDHADHGSTE